MKKLRLSRDNKVIAGVCGGIAEYLNLDVSLIRIVWVIITISTMFWLMSLLYIICWAIMPLNDGDK